MTFTLPETLWLHGHGFGDLLVAYPSADREALAELARLDDERPPIVMVDSVEQLDLIEAAARGAGPVRVCIDLDLSWWPLGGRLKIGVKRSPVHEPAQARALAEEIVRRPGLELAGLMGYEAHIAGVGDRPLGKRLQGYAIRAMKALSVPELAERRAAAVAAVREVADVEIVNGGGTGQHPLDARGEHRHRDHGRLWLLRANSLRPLRLFRLTPAAMFAMPVVRRPSGGVATLLGGGYLASGAAGPDRLPAPELPRGLRLDPLEGAGEVQTPVIGRPPPACAWAQSLPAPCEGRRAVRAIQQPPPAERQRDRRRGPDVPRRGPGRAVDAASTRWRARPTRASGQVPVSPCRLAGVLAALALLACAAAPAFAQQQARTSS